MLRIIFSYVIVVAYYSLCNSVEELSSVEYGIIPGKIDTNCTCGKANRDLGRIIEGSESGVNEFPMMAGIVIKNYYYNGKLDKNYFICGATVITHRHLLSASHCFYDEETLVIYKADNIGILLSAHYRSKFDYNNEMITPERLIIHEDYIFRNSASKCDIAIAVLPYIKFTELIAPACLPVNQFHPGNQLLVSLGWGDTTGWMTLSDVLKKTTVFGRSYKECYGTPYWLCTYRKGTSQCSGDSGGPVMWIDPDTNRYTLVGVNSFVNSKTCQGATVSSDIWYYMPWIQHVIGKTYPEEYTCGKLIMN